MKEHFTSLISFYVQKEVFAFDTLKVRNILEFGKVTWVPNVKNYLLGVINLHGNIIPIADLRVMMGLKEVKNTADTAVIVVSDDGKNSSMIGIVVDSVKEVFDAESITIGECSFNGDTGLISNFLGTAHVNGEFIHIMDLDSVTQEIEN